MSVDFCYGCKFAECMYSQGPNGRMLIHCECPSREGDRVTEEVYSGCKMAEPTKFAIESPELNRMKADVFQILADAGKL